MGGVIRKEVIGRSNWERSNWKEVIKRNCEEMYRDGAIEGRWERRWVKEGRPEHVLRVYICDGGNDRGSTFKGGY